MSPETDSARPVDPGLEALVTLLHLQGVAADSGQIRHRLGTDKIGAPEMLRCAKDLGLKARAYRTDWSRLAKTPLPAIAALRDGGFLVVAKAAEDKVLVQSPLAPRPALMTRAELVAAWDGRLILMTRRAGLSDITRRFDITWFLGAIHKYRHLLGEVLVDRANDRGPGTQNDLSEPKGQELNYSARVSLDRTAMQIDDRSINLSPGMAVTVEIKTGSRMILSYLLSPLLRYRQETLRER
jgi:hypothetical protein